jgi:hypothetical protein
MNLSAEYREMDPAPSETPSKRSDACADFAAHPGENGSHRNAIFWDRTANKIAFAIVAAALVIAWRLPSTNNVDYQAVAVGGDVIRVNVKTGSMVVCNLTKCATLLRQGQRTDPNTALIH